MIQKTIQTNNNLADYNNFENSHLSIQLSLNGLAFCIFDKDLVDVVLLKEYEFENRTQTPEQLLEYVKGVYLEEPLLSKIYDSINVSHKNNLTTIIPEALYDKDSHKDYLKYSVKVLDNDFITTDNLAESSSKSVYIPFKNINDFFEFKYENFSYTHASSTLVSSLLKYIKHNVGRHFFVNVSKNNIDIIYLKDNQLQLFNSFLYYSKEDFLYYILFTMEQLSLNPDEQSLTFIGAIDKNSPLYEIAYTYIRNIDFFVVENYSISEEFYQVNTHIEKHHFFELLNQF